MSKKHYNAFEYNYVNPMYNYGFRGYGTLQNDCGCTFPNLVILILVVLQFGKKETTHGYEIDDGILFIIALFFLSCNNSCSRW